MHFMLHPLSKRLTTLGRLRHFLSTLQPTATLHLSGLSSNHHYFHYRSISNSMKIVPVPCLQDNYGYLLIDTPTGKAAAVDPVQPDRLLAAASTHGAEIQAILTTHHHPDHAGGNEEFTQLRKNLTVYGGDDRIGALTNKVGDGDQFQIGSLEIQAIATPSHTTGHICYYVTNSATDQRVVFTGDTLFIGGCGRFFEGTAEEMLSSLDKLAALPGDTAVYCGHEYTLSNLKFALSVDPHNQALKDKFEFAKANECTVPSSINGERQFNPFMRVRESALQNATGKTEPVDVMQKLRDMKNQFKAT